MKEIKNHLLLIKFMNHNIHTIWNEIKRAKTSNTNIIVLMGDGYPVIMQWNKNVLPVDNSIILKVDTFDTIMSLSDTLNHFNTIESIKKYQDDKLLLKETSGSIAPIESNIQNATNYMVHEVINNWFIPISIYFKQRYKEYDKIDWINIDYDQNTKGHIAPIL